MSGDYEVGYKRPPKHAQFRKGEPSANPNGRPKKIDNGLIKEPKVHKKPKEKANDIVRPRLLEITHQEISAAVVNLPLDELRRRWAKAWGMWPHKHIGRAMLEKSLVFKVKELNGLGLTRLQQEKLAQLVKTYKRNPKCFDDRIGLKAGVRLVKTYRGERINVIVKEDGFEYNGTVYKSLSAIARMITGINRNGWTFFGLKGKRSRW